MKPLDGLRRKLTAWYVATFGAILVAFSVGLFFTIAHSIAAKLDRSLAHAAAQVRESVIERGTAGATPAALKIPDRALYVFDTHGRLITPNTASAPVRRAALDAASSGEASRQFDIGHEHTLLVHALRFVAPNGNALVAVAAADTEELEDEYANLITVVSIALGLSLVAVAVGGYVLARRSSRPVEESFEHMRRFMADAAHELRTPISFLRAHADLSLEQDRSAAEYASAMHEVSAGAERLSRIVDDLFTLARADAGERRLDHEDVYLDDIVLEAARDARTLAHARGLRLDVTQFDEARVRGDARLLGQLVRIVVENAIKYSGQGGAITLCVGVNGPTAEIRVSDTGVGIPASDLPHVFERFYRGMETRHRADGAGLGLSIARWIVEVHGGDIRVESAAGMGTSVSITLPTAVDGADAQDAPAIAPAGTTARVPDVTVA